MSNLIFCTHPGGTADRGTCIYCREELGIGEPISNDVGDKEDFFQGDWRDNWPSDFRPVTKEDITKERADRERMMRSIEALETVCFVCRREIPPFEADCIVTNLTTDRRNLAHQSCAMQEEGVLFLEFKYRHCVGGSEAEEEDEEV